MKKLFHLHKKKKKQHLKTKENMSRIVNSVPQRTNATEKQRPMTLQARVELLKKEIATLERRIINLMLPSNRSITVNGKVLTLPVDQKKMVQLEQKKQQLMAELAGMQQRQPLAIVIKQATTKSNQAQTTRTTQLQKNISTNKAR
ncbi:hypothetical protein CUM72_07530 [Enterococcus durans]|nr:hypothetical protein CUM72_07530 [Enterococcus durans]TKN16009.1 hypothetical protein DVW83_11070 [Enterococcus sp. VV15]